VSEPNPTRANALILVVLVVGNLLLMAGSVRRESGASLLEERIGSASQPVVGAAEKVGGSVRGVTSWLHETRVARSENVRLRAEVERLQAELGRTREQSLENDRLRRLLGMRVGLAPRSVGASVVTFGVSGQSRVLVLDQGAEAGVRPDQAVVAWGGAVGRVVASGNRVSKVRLLTDPNSGVAGVVQRSRVEGMVLGTGKDTVEMAYVPKYADVVVGDRVVTSGLDGVFPRGFGIGTVAVVEEPSGASKKIEIVPEVRFGALEEVLVLIEPVGGGMLAPPETAEAP
jgi:rod shape-determining protein MreC